ncbi:hypothetical protein ACWC9T_18595 [Kitasatospora sp. NPDC001159]
MRNIRQNLFFALAYNATGIPIAAGAMALSSLSVVTNANRLRRWRTAPLPTAAPVAVEPRVEVGREAAPAGEGLTDPVCGMPINLETAAERRETEGGSVYFARPAARPRSTPTPTGTASPRREGDHDQAGRVPAGGPAARDPLCNPPPTAAARSPDGAVGPPRIREGREPR